MISKEEYLKIEKIELYKLYLAIATVPKNYERVSKEEMIDEMKWCLENNTHPIINYLNDEELTLLNKFINNEKIYSDLGLLYNGDLYEGFLPAIKKDLEYYKENKEECENDKELIYYMTGLLYTFGSLTPRDFARLIQRDYEILLPFEILRVTTSPYFRRFVGMEDELYYLRSLNVDPREVLKSHPKTLTLTDSKKAIINRGKYSR